MDPDAHGAGGRAPGVDGTLSPSATERRTDPPPPQDSGQACMYEYIEPGPKDKSRSENGVMQQAEKGERRWVEFHPRGTQAVG